MHLVVDTTLSDKGFSIQAYVSRSLGLADKPLALQFVEVPCDVQFRCGLGAARGEGGAGRDAQWALCCQAAGRSAQRSGSLSAALLCPPWPHPLAVLQRLRVLVGAWRPCCPSAHIGLLTRPHVLLFQPPSQPPTATRRRWAWTCCPAAPAGPAPRR